MGDIPTKAEAKAAQDAFSQFKKTHVPSPCYQQLKADSDVTVHYPGWVRKEDGVSAQALPMVQDALGVAVTNGMLADMGQGTKTTPLSPSQAEALTHVRSCDYPKNGPLSPDSPTNGLLDLDGVRIPPGNGFKAGPSGGLSYTVPLVKNSP